MKIAKALTSPNEYQTEASKIDVSTIANQQKQDLSAKRLFLDNLRLSQKAISVLDSNHRVSQGAFMPNRGIVSPAMRKRPITAKHYAARVAYQDDKHSAITINNPMAMSGKNFHSFFDKVSQSSLESVKDSHTTSQKMSVKKLKSMPAEKVK